MKDEEKPKAQLIREMVELRQWVAELEERSIDRKRVNEALRESELRFRELAELLPQPVFEMDVDGNLTYSNRSGFETFGYAQEDLEQGVNALELYMPEERERVKDNLRKRLAGEEFEDHEYSALRKDGSTFPILVYSASIIRDNKPVGVRGIALDITKRKRTEEALRKQAHDLGERIKELNCLFGISKFIERQDISWGELFQGIVDLIPPAWQYPESTCARAILAGEEYKTENFRETIWRQTRFITIHGKSIGTIEVFHLEEKPVADEGPFLEEERSLLNAISERLGRVLERKRTEEDLQEAYENLEIQVKLRTAELAKTNEELRYEIAERKRMEEALRNSSEKLKSFAYSVIHDLKSPTNGIYGLTERLYRLYRDILDERGRNYCDQILKASVHIAALVEKINDYIETKESPLKIENITVEEIFSIIRDEFSPRLTIRQIEWMEPETVAKIKADRLSMIRTFRNFVDNAFKYGGDTLNEIRIGYEESDEFHTFSVSDDGAGMSGRDYEGIFGLFRRDETSKTIEGAGLGLAIVREIAERHGGKVWAEPGEQKGITFYISISKNL